MNSILSVSHLKIYYPVGNKGFLSIRSKDSKKNQNSGKSKDSRISKDPGKFNTSRNSSNSGEVLVKAVDDVSFELQKGEVMGVVGESGCGKSTLAKAIMQLIPTYQGSIQLKGQELTKMTKKSLRHFRRNFQMVFQDPDASLNPRLTVGEIIKEPLTIFNPEMSKEETERKVQNLMVKVGLEPHMIRRYPHEFSGGQKQRICIARAISIDPLMIICDEAVSALDVSIQAQIINLLNQLKDNRDLTFLFISHDLSVTRYISDRIMVMYLGKIVELGTTEQIIQNPVHPYTRALISSVVQYKPKKKVETVILEGELPSPINPPKGCNFNTRCSVVQPICYEKEPPLLMVKQGREVACFFNDSH